LYFEVNRGQTDESVRFLAHGSGYRLYLTDSEAVLVLAGPAAKRDRTAREPHDVQAIRARFDTKFEAANPAVVRMKLVGAAPALQVRGLEELPGKTNYFLGRDSSKWRTNVPTYMKVRYRNVYPGIDLVYYGNQQQLEHDFVVAPGADPGKILLGFEGADKLEIDARGDPVLHTAGGDLRQRKPVVYQEVEGVRKQIDGHYVLEGPNRFGVRLGVYDASQPLVIDPLLSYSTYLGGIDTDAGAGIAVDAAGNAYVTGRTASLDFPATVGAYRSVPALPGGSFGSNVFVTKLNPSCTALVYSAYIGGSADDQGMGIAVDASGNAYVTGITSSPDFPITPEAVQAALADPSGGYDAFVIKLDPSGSSLVYPTYLGGIGSYDWGASIAVDTPGNAYVAGATWSLDFPTTAGAFQPVFPGMNRYGASTAFVTKLNPTGTALVYSTYLGGSSDRAGDAATGIVVDAAGNAFITGTTSSPNFPTTPGAFQTALAANSISIPMDAFVTKLNPAGSALVYSTFLGGTGDDAASGMALDTDGNAYVTGQTSGDFPTTAGVYQPRPGLSANAFVTKLNPTGSGLVYSTYLGGNASAYGSSIAIDTARNAYLTGGIYQTCGQYSCINDFPTTLGAFQPNYGGGAEDAFVAKLNSLASALVYSSYLGGSGFDGGAGIAVNGTGNAYVTGATNSINFPTTLGAFQPVYGGGLGGDAFVAKIAP